MIVSSPHVAIRRVLPSHLFTFVLVGLFLAPGCADKTPEPERYAVRGEYKGSQFDGKVAVIFHEEIPGLMEAMQMGFKLEHPEEITTLTGGEAISFDLLMRGNDWSIENIVVLPEGTVLEIADDEDQSTGHQH